MFNFKFKLNNRKTSRSASNLSQNPKVLEVNLIKNEIPVDFEFAKHISTLIFSLAVTGLFIAEIYFGMNWWSQYESERVLTAEAKFSQVSKEIKDMKSDSDQILAFKKRVDLADALLSNHIYWTNFFNWLEKNTLSSVNYLGFSGESDGIYELQATAKSFRDISWQTRALLEDPAVVSVYVDSGSAARSEDEEQSGATEKVSFVLNLKIDPKIFKASAQ